MKKIMGVIVAGSLLVSSYAGMPVYAAEESSAAIVTEQQNTQDDNAKELEEAISIAKKKIKVPSSYVKFSYAVSQTDYMDKKVYNLHWNNKKDTEWIDVSVMDGEVKNYFKGNSSQASYAPKYTKKELKKKADAFLKQVVPKQYNSTKYQNTVEKNIYAGTYTYFYQRMEQKIPVKDNQIRIEMNYETGEAVEMTVNFDKVSLPEASKLISKADAKEALKQIFSMELTYRRNYSDNGSANKAYLVYEPNLDDIVIDAITGKQVTKEEILQGTTDAEEQVMDSAQNSAGAGKGDALTQSERTKVEKLKKLLTQSQVVAMLKGKANLDLDASYDTVIGNLYKWDTNGDSGYVWRLEFASTEKDGNSFATARMNAETGELYQFSSYRYTTGNGGTAHYTREQCQKKMEDFIVSEHPEYQKRIQYRENNRDFYIIGKSMGNTNPEFYDVEYVDSHNGIPYLDNSFSGRVDAVSGKIVSYYANWNDDTRFEKADGCMSEEQAKNAYLKLCELTPKYVIYENQTGQIARLEYEANIWPKRISPFSGKQLDYDGTPYEEKEDDFQYTDIKKSPYKKYIEQLAELGVGFSGKKFQPDKAITKGEFEQWLNELDISYGQTPTGAKAKKLMTHMDTAKRCISVLGYTKVAKLDGIYDTVFTDMNTIAKKDRGYAALAKGLGLITGKEFQAKKNVTREEAAKIVLKMLKLK